MMEATLCPKMNLTINVWRWLAKNPESQIPHKSNDSAATAYKLQIIIIIRY